MVTLTSGKELQGFYPKTSFLETKHTTIQPTKWLVKGLIPMGHIVLVSSKPGHGKSFLCENIAIDVASEDSDFMGLPTRHGKVVLIDEDTPKDNLITRLAAFERASGNPLHDIDYYSKEGLRFKDKSGDPSWLTRDYRSPWKV